MEKRMSSYIIRVAELDKEITNAHMNIMRLERERTRIGKAMINELYEQEQTI